MSLRTRSILFAAIQLAVILALGGKLLLDRARYPRTWVRTRAYDPDLPIRGRYVQLMLDETSAPGVPGVAVPFFIPEKATDPSRPRPGEGLWIEVTLPPHGPPRPIRLGVKRGGGEIEPLALD